MQPEDPPGDHLPRLGPAAYRGKAIIHWSFTMDERREGWLDDAFHQEFRWCLLHACARYTAACPVYCLMPDHMHLLIAGWDAATDQRLLVRFLRKHLAPMLAQRNVAWQKQPYDHVLREQEREPGGFESVARYIMENPVRAALVGERSEWSFTGCVLPGYPELNLWMGDYWQRYWRIVASRNKQPPP
jgi:putative transposase